MSNMLQILVSFIVTLFLSIPFINFLYKIKFQTLNQREEDDFGKKELFNKLHAHKSGTPTGGGLLIISMLAFIFFIINFKSRSNFQMSAILITLILFWFLGLYDDSKKLFEIKRGGFFGLRIRHKLLLQILASLFISIYLYGNGLSSISVPYLGQVYLGLSYILFSTIFITFITNCFNITDGLDGLSPGIYLLIGFGLLASSQTAIISSYLSISIGCVLAYMYFNVKPARYYYGDTGALPLGASLAVVALLTQVEILSVILYGLIIIEGTSSLIQWASKKYRAGKKVFLIAPIHHHFEALGWEEARVVERFWLVQVVLVISFVLLHQFFI